MAEQFEQLRHPALVLACKSHFTYEEHTVSTSHDFLGTDSPKTFLLWQEWHTRRARFFFDSRTEKAQKLRFSAMETTHVDS